jgi:hypothetical protein
MWLMEGWPLLSIPEGTDAELISHCWEYFCRAYIRDADGVPIVVTDWRGTVVRVSRNTYDHVVSGHRDYRDGLGLHELPFVRERAKRLPWIGFTLDGRAVTEVRHQELSTNRGRRRKRRVLIVTEAAYVVVLDRQDDGCLRLRTAFPADASYLRKIRSEGSQIEIHRPVPEKEMPQS